MGKVKILIAAFAALLLVACNSSQKSTPENEADVKAINDSITQLILSFQQNQDSTALQSALLLSDKALALDTSYSNKIYTINTKAQILWLLGRNKEAFLLKEKTLSSNKSDVERLIYYGQKYKLAGRTDSSTIYFDEAIIQCDKQLKDTFDILVVLRKSDIYIQQDKKAEALHVINQALSIDPHNETLNLLKEDFDGYCELVNGMLSNIEL